MSASSFLKFFTIFILGLVMVMPAVAQEGENKTDDSKAVTTEDPEKDPEGDRVNAYYSNYLSEYRLGPQDIISVTVFQQPDYSRIDIVVPPTARISYPLIREGVFVGGRTVEEVADIITEELSEYIIDPKVTVTLNRPGSARYAVMGKVNVPGVRIMDRRVSINEALIEAGGLAKGASRDKVVIARFDSEGRMSTENVDLKGIESGKIPTIFLKPGDQVYVGEKGFTWSKFLNVIGQASAARILFGSPF